MNSESKHVEENSEKLDHSNNILSTTIPSKKNQNDEKKTYIHIHREIRRNANKTKPNKYIPWYKMINYYDCAIFIAKNFTIKMVNI